MERRQTRRNIGLLCAAYVITVLFALPFAHLPGPVLPAASTTFGAAVLVAELCTGFLLLVQYRARPSWAMLLLAAAYLYGAAMAMLHILSFPGAWLPEGILVGNAQTVGWLFIFWMVGFPAWILAAAIAEARSGDRTIPPGQAGRAFAIVAAILTTIVAALSISAMSENSWIPRQIEGNSFAGWGKAVQWVSVGLALASVLVLWLANRGRSTLFDWLCLALIAFSAFNILSVMGGGRYTVGWTLSRISGFISAGLLLVFFMGQFARLQRSLSAALDDLREANEGLEQRVAQRTAEVEESRRHLRTALDEKELLLREIYHRVKNNLQLLDSFIAIQSQMLDTISPGEILGDLRHRINALGLVHQQLMTSEDLATFDIRPFLEELRTNLATATDIEGQGISITVEAVPVSVDLDFAIPLGLMVTELVTNAVKHAFRHGRPGTISVRLARCADDTLLLTVEDDGNGSVQGSGTPGPDGGFGSMIIRALVAQLEGEMAVRGEDGTKVEIRMPVPGVSR